MSTIDQLIDSMGDTFIALSRSRRTERDLWQVRFVARDGRVSITKGQPDAETALRDALWAISMPVELTGAHPGNPTTGT